MGPAHLIILSISGLHCAGTQVPGYGTVSTNLLLIIKSVFEL